MRAGLAGRPAAVLLAATVLLIAGPVGPGVAFAQDAGADRSEDASRDLPAPGSAFIFSLVTTAAAVAGGTVYVTPSGGVGLAANLRF